MFRHSIRNRAIFSLGAILILAAGCADQGPTESALTPHVAALSRAHTAGTVAKTIGPRGGTLEFGIGSLSFPAGAVSENTRITATLDGRNLGVTFGPHGLVFPAGAQPELVLDVRGVQVPVHTSIYYVTEAGAVLERYEPEWDALEAVARVRLGHFSRYILAAE